MVRRRKERCHNYISRGIIFVIALSILSITVYWKNIESQWRRVSYLSLTDKTEKVLSDYARLYKIMRGNSLFLYNYGAILHEVGHWRECTEILKECSHNINDTDIQMLLADNYFKLEKFDEAELHYLRAAEMCPNRFLPLYHLVKLYERTGRSEDAQTLARKIVAKQVKIPSYTIKKIKKEMQGYIDKKNTNTYLLEKSEHFQNIDYWNIENKF